MIEDKNIPPVETAQSAAATVAGVETRYLMPESPDRGTEITERGSRRIERWWKTAARSGQVALVMAELTPINEISRLGVYGLTETMTRDPIAGAAALGLSTFVLESAGGLATASILDSERSTKMFTAINEKGKKMKLPTDKNLPVSTKTGATLMLGTPFGMLLEQRENPHRTKEENRRYALFTSAWQAGVLAVVGAMGSEVVEKVVEDPKTGLIAAAGVGGAAGAGAWAKKKAGTIKVKFSKTKKN